VGELHVGHHQIERRRGDPIEGDLTVGHLRDVVACVAEPRGDRLTNIRVVLYQHRTRSEKRGECVSETPRTV
jgi:hypothetical protein